MGSWIITFTFIFTCLYLTYEGRKFHPLNLLSYTATALMMCFSGLLFSAVISYLSAQTGTPLQNDILLGLLVLIGVVISLLVRHGWNRNRS